MTTHGSIFAGIGGIDLGFRWAGIETVWQVEKDPFCRRVLEKNFPEARRFPDVRKCGGHNLEKVDVISGGFPCQDISVAGKRAGLDGGQSRLWFEQARVVRELRPTWVFIENVARLLYTDGDRVLSEMEEADYACWPVVLGAKEIGATHKRSRAWILCHRANTDGTGHSGLGGDRAVGEALAEAIEGWNGRAKALLDAGDGRAGADAYAGIVRAIHGIPDWVDRLEALGNAAVPQIAALFGSFIQKAETQAG